MVRHIGKKNTGSLPHTTHKINYNKDLKVKDKSLKKYTDIPIVSGGKRKTMETTTRKVKN